MQRAPSPEYAKAEDWLRPIATIYPSVPHYSGWIAVVYVCRARTLFTMKDIAKASAVADQAVGAWQEIHGAGPAVTPTPKMAWALH